jgi:hypothetical protein
MFRLLPTTAQTSNAESHMLRHPTYHSRNNASNKFHIPSSSSVSVMVIKPIAEAVIL